MNVLRRKGYAAAVTFDAREGLLVGRVLGIDDVVEFHGETAARLEQAFRIAVDDYHAACRALKRKPQRSHSGELRLRMLPRTHARAAMAAAARGMSLNTWIEEAMRRAAKVDLGEV